jgi:hypothetical protein
VVVVVDSRIWWLFVSSRVAKRENQACRTRLEVKAKRRQGGRGKLALRDVSAAVRFSEESEAGQGGPRELHGTSLCLEISMLDRV